MLEDNIIEKENIIEKNPEKLSNIVTDLIKEEFSLYFDEKIIEKLTMGEVLKKEHLSLSSIYDHQFDNLLPSLLNLIDSIPMLFNGKIGESTNQLLDDHLPDSPLKRNFKVLVDFIEDLALKYGRIDQDYLKKEIHEKIKLNHQSLIDRLVKYIKINKEQKERIQVLLLEDDYEADQIASLSYTTMIFLRNFYENITLRQVIDISNMKSITSESDFEFIESICSL